MEALEDLVGTSPAMGALRRRLGRLASAPPHGDRAAAILIQGETGTGKGLVARIIHRLGPRTAGAFVSLHRRGELRGCIGTFSRDRPLHRVVREMAVAAAFEDPRFLPVRGDEVDSIDIEISLLSELRRTEPEFVVPGLHGVSIVVGEHKGVFLPQVAAEAGWDREALLEQTCLKAGLPANAWRDPAAEVSVFTAEVFRDP
jgi:AmmeMemoRadiSam system protein A